MEKPDAKADLEPCIPAAGFAEEEAEQRTCLVEAVEPEVRDDLLHLESEVSPSSRIGAVTGTVFHLAEELVVAQVVDDQQRTAGTHDPMQFGNPARRVPSFGGEEVGPGRIGGVE